MKPVEGQGIRIEDLPNELVIKTFSYLKMQDLMNWSQVSKRFRENVADELGRRKEDLLKIILDFQCFKCKKVPRPNLSERYLCEYSSHSLCEKHRRCPCGSLANKTPSKSIAIKLQNLPWMCQNYKRGCNEVKMDVNNLKIHHGKCIFRKVFCPHPDCSKFNRVDPCHTPTWRCRRACHWGRRVCFKDIFDHFNAKHKKIWHQINGESNKWMDLIDRIFPDFSNGYSWYSGKMTSTNSDVFAVFARVHRYA